MRSRPLIGCTTYRKETMIGYPVEIDGLMPTYSSAILAAGGLPVLIPQAIPHDELDLLLDELDGLLMPGGGDIEPTRYQGSIHDKIYGVDGRRDDIELFLAREAVARDKPLLAICRGHQILNVAMGGTLWEDVLDLMPNADRHAYFIGYERDRISHDVRICSDSKLAKIAGEEYQPVNSLHHQGIKRLGSSLTPVAYAPDGLIEGIEIQDHRFALGVQWHPEELFRAHAGAAALFEAFVDACR
jgi:putative glutamine amidotransferase